MRITRFIGVFVSIIGIFFTASSYGVITSSSITSYVAAPTTSIGPSGEIELESYQGILPNAGYTPASDALIGKNIRDEGYIIIFGINITSDSGQRLVSAALNMEGTLTIDSAVITDRSGRILGWISGGSGIFQLSEPISNLEDEYDDFFVAIRTTDVHRNYPYDYMNEKMATFGLKSIMVSPVDPEGNDVESPSATTAPIRCELIIRDILPEPCDNRPYPLYPQYPVYYQYQPGEMVRPRYDWTPQDYQYAPISEQHSVPQVIPWNTLTPVIAIGCAQRNVTPPTLGYDVNIQNPGEELKSVTLTITDVGIEDFDPSYSLIITLWRDNGDGVWTETDIYLEQFEMSSFTKVDNKREWTVKL
ncbi:MAG TPA: hypothetical protein PKX05_03920, partial [bacterium]|nr:hypothetical protein [bacterium]